MPRLPAGAHSHVKYPVVIDDGAFRAKTGFSHRIDERDTLREFRMADAGANAAGEV
jgi:UDP-glucose 4-epimerase